jgi:serine/threonine protein kinase
MSAETYSATQSEGGWLMNTAEELRTTSRCPNRQQLAAFSVGKLPPPVLDRIAGHLSSCSSCVEVVAELESSHDALVSELRRPPEPELGTPSQQSRVIEIIRSIGLESGFGGSLDQELAAASKAREMEVDDVRDYRLLRKLDEGGMGAVYEAVHTKLGKKVALKILPAERMAHDEAVERFYREMRAVGKLDHPNIIGAHDAGEHQGRHFLVMERVQGTNLSSLVKQLGPLPVADACEIVCQAAAGLQHAHEHGMVHRDVKPSNLMLTTEAHVKVLDLGLALLNDEQVDEELTSTGQLMGTLDYMAPEQTDDSHGVDIRADIYSLGATLYKLLCGHAPYSAAKHRTPAQKIRAIASTSPTPIRDRRPEVPSELAAVLDRMLAKEPGERYAIPADASDALRPFAAGCDLPRLVAESAAGCGICGRTGIR